MKAALKFPAMAAKFSLSLLTATGVAAVACPSDPSATLVSIFPGEIRVAFDAVARSSRTFFTIASNVVDYTYSLRGLDKDSEEYKRQLAEVHLRSSERILKLCKANKGFYVKAGQFAASLRQLPKEYTTSLSVLQDQAVPCQFKLIKEVLCRSLNADFDDLFLSFDEQPIAAASIAQVHHAVLKNHKEVAVKVRYPGLERLMKLDIATMSLVSTFVAWLFPEYRFGWILPAFTEAIAAELDFIQEARNSERAARNLQSYSYVKIPRVFWELTRSQVLTMQFLTGHKVDDVESLKKDGIDPAKVAKALLEVFADMIFIHGFVHGDPHPGNILVSPDDKNGFNLVLLDHGIYKELDEGFRIDYCQLWRALIIWDSMKIEQIGEKFGVGKYARYLPLIFTGKPINSKSSLGKGMSIEERKMVKQELRNLGFEDISSFMESLPTDFLIILRTDGVLRSLLSKLGASRSVRLLTYAKYAIYGLSSSGKQKSGSSVDSFASGLKAKFNYLQFRCLLGFLELLSWVEEIRHHFINRLRSWIVTTRHLASSYTKATT